MGYYLYENSKKTKGIELIFISIWKIFFIVGVFLFIHFAVSNNIHEKDSQILPYVKIIEQIKAVKKYFDKYNAGLILTEQENIQIGYIFFSIIISITILSMICGIIVVGKYIFLGGLITFNKIAIIVFFIMGLFISVFVGFVYTPYSLIKSIINIFKGLGMCFSKQQINIEDCYYVQDDDDLNYDFLDNNKHIE